MPGLTRLAVTRLVTGAFAWSSSGKTNDDLVTNLVRDRRLKLPAVEAALRRVDRKTFVLPAERGAAYDDRPLGIGYSATISAPHMHAAALEFLAPSIAEKGRRDARLVPRSTRANQRRRRERFAGVTIFRAEEQHRTTTL